MKATKNIIIMLFMTITMNAHAQSASEFATQFNGQEGMQYHNMTSFVEEVRKHLDAMRNNGTPGQMPPGVPTIEEFKAFYAKIKTAEVVFTEAGPRAMRLHGSIRTLKDYVPLITYADGIEEPTFEDGPDNVRRMQLPASYRVPGYVYQAYGRVSDQNVISDLIIFTVTPNNATATSVTGNMNIEDLKMFYNMMQSLQTQRSEQERP